MQLNLASKDNRRITDTRIADMPHNFYSRLNLSFTMQPLDTSAIDQLDIGILKSLQEDALIPAARIGERIGLSAAAVQRRIKRMRQNGVIQATIAQVNPKAVGFPISCWVSVDLDYENTAEIDQFSRSASAHPQVQQCYYVTGPNDFILLVLSKDMEHYERFTRALFLDNKNVKCFTTHVVLNTFLQSLKVPIE